jgi:hypothetical protein
MPLSPVYYTCTAIGGRICIACAQTDYVSPGIIIHHWPTNMPAASYPELIGKSGPDWISGGGYGDGRFRVRFGSSWSFHSRDCYLVDGGRTKSIHVETRAYPCPKSGGKETKYERGNWFKLLKSGWVQLLTPSLFVATAEIKSCDLCPPVAA